MRLPDSAHTLHSWRIHELTPDFRLEDVWELPWNGGPDDFPPLVQRLASFDPTTTSWVVRTLFDVRRQLGERFGWDEPVGAPGAPVESLRTRLPADLRDSPTGPGMALAPSTPLFLLEDEWAVEIVNETVHGVLHLGLVDHRARLAILVKPKGLLGQAYLAFIRPFRHLLVYPAILRQLEREAVVT